MNEDNGFYTVRITFSKTGPARFISHLDLNRTMTRALRRAQVPIWYTEGFNKHPYVTFSSPLSLGYEGLNETMDVRLERDISLNDLTRRLDRVMPVGLHILQAAPAIQKAGQVDRAVYEMTIGYPAQMVHQLFDCPEIRVGKRTKSNDVKMIDLKPVLDACDPMITDCGDTTVIRLTLPANSKLSVNPSLIISALAADGDRPICHICRLAILDKDGNIFA